MESTELRIVIDYLRLIGYHKVNFIDDNGWIEADSGARIIAVMIGEFDEEEISRFKKKVVKKCSAREPWLATVNMEDNNYIAWRNLTK